MPVYLIRAGEDGPIKIGHGKNPAARRSHLQGGSSQTLILLGILPGSKPEEQELHRRFDSDHIRGEWFRFNPAMLIGAESPPKKERREKKKRDPSIHPVDASRARDFDELIRSWPSISDLANSIGCPYGVVKQWRMRKSIPARYWGAIIRDTERRGAGISAKLLADLSAARGDRSATENAAECSPI